MFHAFVNLLSYSIHLSIFTISDRFFLSFTCTCTVSKNFWALKHGVNNMFQVVNFGIKEFFFCRGILVPDNCTDWVILQEGLEDIKLAHAEQLTQMRLPDISITLKSINESQSIIIRKRKHRCESTLYLPNKGYLVNLFELSGWT